jgi:hypothetical protein
MALLSEMTDLEGRVRFSYVYLVNGSSGCRFSAEHNVTTQHFTACQYAKLC